MFESRLNDRSYPISAYHVVESMSCAVSESRYGAPANIHGADSLIHELDIVDLMRDP